jgi:hypothetical protein
MDILAEQHMRECVNHYTEAEHPCYHTEPQQVLRLVFCREEVRSYDTVSRKVQGSESDV